MAKIGLNNFRYAVATVNASTGAITYGAIATPAKAISFSFEPSIAEAKLYADDVEQETAYVITGGDVTMGVDREDLETLAALLGHTYSNGEVVDNVNDTAPYVGVGRVTKIMEDGVIKYRGTVLSLVKFKEPSEEDNSQGESIEFNTTELSGTMVVPVDGNWRHREVFTTKAAAISYVESCLTTSGA